MLARSKVMGPMFRLPFLYIVLVDFGRNGFVILTMILFLKKHSFSFIDEFLLFLMYSPCFLLKLVLSYMLLPFFAQCSVACGSKDRPP